MEHVLDRTAGRSLDRSFSSFDTMAVLAGLKADIAQAREGRSTTILHKEEGLQVALVAMRAGSRTDTYKEQVPITVYVIDGLIRFKTHMGSRKLGSGKLLTLHARLPHALAALQDSTFLLIFAGAPGQEESSAPRSSGSGPLRCDMALRG